MRIDRQFDSLIENEGWDIIQQDGGLYVVAMGEKVPYAHPFAVWSKIYRNTGNPTIKFNALRAMHSYCWPDYEETWHYWDERRLRAFAEGYTYQSYASGASTGKSDFAARIALLFFMANPRGRTVLVASTTLQALSTRIWGYISRFSNQIAINFPIHLLGGSGGTAPKILFDKRDPIHGMYALAAGKGTDEKAIANWIGRHPKEGILVILDEATDLEPVLLKSLPNLESGGVEFHCMVIGNSCSRFDLHGSLSTPSVGWNNIDLENQTSWPTTKKNGICLYFNPEESPAIHEKDPIKKAKLEKFLITGAQIESKKKEYGENSVEYWRFVKGLWKEDSADETIISEKFMSHFNVTSGAEWSGLHRVNIVGGLDPAFSQGGDSCILRLALLGHMSNGQVVLDFRRDDLLFKIPLMANEGTAAEIQLATRVITILNNYGCPLSNICIDSNGQGRAIGEVIRLKMNTLENPFKIYSVRQAGQPSKSFDIIIKSSYDLWYDFRKFIQAGQIKGLDTTAMRQFTSRLVEIKNGKQILESKPQYKTRLGAVNSSLAHSPDEADAAALTLQAAILKFGFTPGQYKEPPQETDFIMQKLAAMQNAMVVQEEHGKKVDLAGDFSCDIYSANQIKTPFS